MPELTYMAVGVGAFLTLCIVSGLVKLAISEIQLRMEFKRSAKYYRENPLEFQKNMKIIEDAIIHYAGLELPSTNA